MKDVDRRRDLDDDRENGTNSDDRKGKPLEYDKVEALLSTSLCNLVDMGSSAPAHDELDLDTAE